MTGPFPINIKSTQHQKHLKSALALALAWQALASFKTPATINIEALCAALPEALASPSQMRLA